MSALPAKWSAVAATDVEHPRSERPGLSVERLEQSGYAEWQDFVVSHPDAALYHDIGWRDLVGTVFGHDAPYLVARNAQGALQGVLPLVHIRSRLFGNYLVSLPYFTYGGPLATSAAVEAALMRAGGELAAGSGARHVEFRCGKRSASDYATRDDKVSMHLALEPTVDLMLKRLSSQRRAQIRKAEKAGIELRRGGRELLADFYTVFARNMRDLGTPVYARRLFLAILERFADRSVIVSARVGGKPAAAAFLLEHRDRMEVPWVSTLREYNSLNANTLLYWELLKVAIERGCRTFDFGRSSKGSGTFEFKKQWGAVPVQLYWHYWLAPGVALPGLTPANPRFALAIKAWQRLPVAVANLLGPLIVKDLP